MTYKYLVKVLNPVSFREAVHCTGTGRTVCTAVVQYMYWRLLHVRRHCRVCMRSAQCGTMLSENVAPNIRSGSSCCNTALHSVRCCRPTSITHIQYYKKLRCRRRKRATLSLENLDFLMSAYFTRSTDRAYDEQKGQTFLMGRPTWSLTHCSCFAMINCILY